MHSRHYLPTFGLNIVIIKCVLFINGMFKYLVLQLLFKIFYKSFKSVVSLKPVLIKGDILVIFLNMNVDICLRNSIQVEL